MRGYPATSLAAALTACLSLACDPGTGRGLSAPDPAGWAGATEPSGEEEVPGSPRDHPLRAGFVVVDGVYGTELVAPFDVLEHTVHHAPPGIDVFAVSPDGGPVVTAEGLRLLPRHGFADAPTIDILVVPSAEESRGRDLENRTLIDFVHRSGSGAQMVMSLCWGAFVLAEAGLLEGRAATTFPADYRRFQDRYPGIDVKVNVSFVHDGRFLTSQGGVRSYDAAMYLVDLLYGPEVATRIGRGLLLPWPPDPDRAPPFLTDPAFRARWRSH